MEERNSGRSGGGRRYFTVSDREQARLLSEPRFQSAFRPFLAREASASAAAREAGVDLNAMLYRIRLLLKAGLIEVVRSEKRQGRPIKIYRSVHDAYFVPYEVTPFADLEERLWSQAAPELRRLVALQARHLQASGTFGQRLFRDDRGEVWAQSAASGDDATWPHPGRPAGIDYWTDLKLTDEESRELQLTLYQVLNEYAPANASAAPSANVGADRGAATSTDVGAAGKRYRLSVALVRLDD